jgi:hypothetical protein
MHSGVSFFGALTSVETFHASPQESNDTAHLQRSDSKDKIRWKPLSSHTRDYFFPSATTAMV